MIQTSQMNINIYNIAYAIKNLNVIQDIDTNCKEDLHYRKCQMNFVHLFLLASFSCHSFHLL